MKNNKIRIIGGCLKSRVIYLKNFDELRPTNDIIREKLFNWLGQDLTGKVVLDLFGGSGVLGFESSSRGAIKVTIVEKNTQIFQLLHKNLNILKLDNVNIINNDALRFLKLSKDNYDVIFLDPPYLWDKWNILLANIVPIINKNTLIFIETSCKVNLNINNFEIIKEDTRGISKYILIRLKI